MHRISHFVSLIQVFGLLFPFFSFSAMSSTMRAIDLVTLTVAPILTGQIMTYASTSIGALFIGGWNLVSVFVEYYLLWKVYDIVPALREKKFKRRMDKGLCVLHRFS